MSHLCFLASLESRGFLVQEKKQNNRFFKMAAMADLCLSVQEKKQKIDFQDGCHSGHLGFPIGTILAIFDLQVTQMLPSKFGVNWPFRSGEEAKNRFSRWRPWQPSWILAGTILAIFDLQVTPMLPSKFGVNWPLGSGEDAKNTFSRWRPSWISDRHHFSYF